MLPTSNYPNGFGANGVSVLGMPLLNTYPGNVFWVNSTIGGNKGTRAKPFTTIQYALDKCKADQGDIIMCGPGHAETVVAAAGLDLDVAGVTLIGLGRGAKRPTITFSTLIGADMDVDAANITMSNFLFVNGIDNLTAPIDVNAAYFSMIGCETRDNNASYHCDDFIVTDAAADSLFIDGWYHNAYGGKTGAQTALSIVGGNDIVVKNWDIEGDFATALIENATTKTENIRIYGDGQCFGRSTNSADVIVTLHANATGFIGPNINARLKDNAANITEAFVGADMQFMQPINICNADGEVGMQTNITASTDAS